MKKNILLLITTVFLLFSCAQEDELQAPKKEINSSLLEVNAKKNESGTLVGVCSKENFSEDNDFKNWFNNNYNNYKTDKNTLDELKTKLQGIKIKAFMGTWCGDSRREIPKFYKVMNEINFTNFDLIAIDRNRKANGLEKGAVSEGSKLYVPTIILYRGNKEIGRFVEKVTTDPTTENYSKKAIEKDLLTIVKGLEYKPYK